MLTQIRRMVTAPFRVFDPAAQIERMRREAAEEARQEWHREQNVKHIAAFWPSRHIWPSCFERDAFGDPWPEDIKRLLHTCDELEESQERLRVAIKGWLARRKE